MKGGLNKYNMNTKRLGLLSTLGASLALLVGCNTPNGQVVGEFTEDKIDYNIVYNPVKNNEGNIQSRIYIATKNDGKVITEGIIFRNDYFLLNNDANVNRDYNANQVKQDKQSLTDLTGRINSLESQLTETKVKADKYDAAVAKSQNK
jgi:hypothetical protein